MASKTKRVMHIKMGQCVLDGGIKLKICMLSFFITSWYFCNSINNVKILDIVKIIYGLTIVVRQSAV